MDLYMVKAVFAGSFDPITNGHIDILKQASEIFDEVIIAVAYNPDKKGFLPVDKRLAIIKECVKNFHNVKVDSYDGLTVNYAKENNAKVLVRGVRNSNDYEYELQLAQTNRMLNPEIKTVFLTPKAENSYISSSVVREILSHNGDISSLVPEAVLKLL